MKTSVKVGLGFALVSIFFTLTLLSLDKNMEGFEIGIFTNVFLVLCAVSVGLYLTKRKENFAPSAFLTDFKVSMQSGAMFALVVSLFVYIYHEKIDTEIRDTMHHNRMVALKEAFPDEASYEILQADDPTWKNKSYDDYMENQEDQSKSMYSSASVAIFHMAGLLFFSFFYSFFAVVILKRIVLR